jgi:ABC-2 type transport system permease protein
MYSLLKKEITSFFGSLTGYVVVFVFLLATSLFLWVFPGNFNIPDSGYASLDGLFGLAPWVYLFLVPAVTMRLFAEEMRLGTMEVLLTRPLSVWQIVLAKYLAGLLLVVISLLPTFLYFYSVYMLGNPIGCIDMGGTWGAYIGLFFLAAIYVAIGLFASALTDNPVFAFLLAMALSFLMYLGFDFVGSMQFSSAIQQFLINIGINEHYQSVSRGVVDSRDVVYFLVVIALFIFLTSRIIHFRRANFRKELKKGIFLIGTLLIILVLSGQFFFRIDLTAEKRYSLSDVSKQLVENLEKPVDITLYLDGEMPAGFRKLQKSIVQKIDDYNAWASQRINLIIVDPYQISDIKRREQLFARLSEEGLQPTDIRQNTDQGTITRRIYPGAIVQYGDKRLSLNLLKNNALLGFEQNFNNSIESLEYEFSEAFSELIATKKQMVAFLKGQGELNEYETHDIVGALSAKYEIANTTAGELPLNNGRIKALIVANPAKPFTEKDKFYIDQYLMNGGRMLWLVDPVSVSLDSLSTGFMTLAFPRQLNLDDQMFRYGIRLNSNLVQDAECLLIPVNTAPAGSPPKFTPAPWYYSPLLLPSPNSVISRNLNRIKSDFVSTIDTVGRMPQVKKTVILTTSDHSLVTQTPQEISLASINNPPSRSLFHEPAQTTGILLEGIFPSAFRNRIVTDLGVNSSEVKAESKLTKVIVFSDGDLIANPYHISGEKVEYMPLGYDRFSQQTFGNEGLILNSVNYLCDDDGLMQLRGRNFKIRLLDKVRLKEEKLVWQVINVVVPLLLIGAIGGFYGLFRRRKYRF